MARSFASASSQYLESVSFPNVSLPLTIAAWFFTSTTASIQRVATWGSSDGAYNGGSIILNYPSGGDVCNQVIPPNELPFKSGVSANTWHHACAVSETTSARIYLDGVAGADKTYLLPTFVSATRFQIGKITSVQYLNGRACHVAVWSGVALTASEAADLAAGCHPRRIRPASLLAHYALGGFEGEDDVDRVGGYNLTPYNSPTWVDQPRIIYPQGPLDVQLSSGGSPPAATPWLYARRSARIIGGGLS